MAYFYKQPLEESRTKTLKGDAYERWEGLWEMCFNWVHYQRLALSSKCSLHCLIYENGPGLFKYLFLCHLTRCQILSVEGAGETLQEERVVLPASSVLIYRLLQCLEGPRLLRDTQPLQHRSLQGRGTRDTQRLAASPAPLQGVL